MPTKQEKPMSKHTEGPWRAGYGSVHAAEPVGTREARSDLIAVVYPCQEELDSGAIAYSEGDEEMAKANARLIAASPELLEYALLEAEFEKVLDNIDDPNTPTLLDWKRAHGIDGNVQQWLVNKRKAAIAKATGEPNAN